MTGSRPLDPLPIDGQIGAIRDAMSRHRAVVVVAEPGAGKTTRVPPALAEDGPVIVLQPRRVAARSLARRIARERGWQLGREVGWHVRFDKNFSDDTRLLVATEGVLAARAASDPLLGAFRTVVVDEFHERSLNADMALAFARQAWLARSDLGLVVMSATLDAGPVSRYLGDAPVVTVRGRPHPVSIEHAPRTAPSDAIRDALDHAEGDVLVFLPGAPEIHALARAIRADAAARGARVLTLSGRSTPAEQDDALAPSAARRVILATNVAETSITVPGVRTIIDTGLHKVPRFDPAVGLDRLETERVSRDSADQRAGRAGRIAPGRAIRLWDARDILRDHREPEIARVDLAAPILDVLAWGGDPARFEWFEAPGADAVTSALTLLARVGAVDAGRLTPLGALIHRLPVHPRLARMLISAGGSRLSAACAAVLSENPALPLAETAAASDVLARADLIDRAPESVRRAAGEIAAIASRALGEPRSRPVAAAHRRTGPDDETIVRHALLDGFPDRLAGRRAAGSPRVILASGHGGVLDRDSVVKDGEFLLALDVTASARGPSAEARVRVASRVERWWLPEPARTIEHRLDADGTVRAVAVDRIHDLVVAESPVRPDPEAALEILAAAFVARGITPDQEGAARRIRLAGLEIDLAAMARTCCAGETRLPQLDLLGGLDHAARQTLGRDAPETIALPSGRRASLEYRDDGSVAASVKLQELFGLADSPRIGRTRTPVVFKLLAPNGRPVQTTQDLRSFWETTYPVVRKELRARYPRHPWPEDPWTAVPTHRPKPRGT